MVIFSTGCCFQQYHTLSANFYLIRYVCCYIIIHLPFVLLTSTSSFYQYNQTYYTNFKVFSCPFHHFILSPLFPLSIFNVIYFSHLPQLKVCYDLKTTSGISLLSQHFNIIGGLLGVYSMPPSLLPSLLSRLLPPARFLRYYIIRIIYHLHPNYNHLLSFIIIYNHL